MGLPKTVQLTLAMRLSSTLLRCFSVNIENAAISKTPKATAVMMALRFML